MDSPPSAPLSSPPAASERSRKKPSLRGVAALLMAGLALAAIYCIFGIGVSGGLFKHLGELMAEEHALFPGTEDPLLREFTGLKVIDGQLATLAPFFAPIVQKSSISLGLFAIWMIGQCGAGWALFVMESLRAGNRGKAASYVGTYGLFFQNFTFALMTPIFLLVHLLTSPISKPFPSTHATSVLLVPTLDLAILPISVILGFIVPSILAGLPAPSVITTHTQQMLLAFWQPFPLWTVLIQFVLRKTVSIFIQRGSKAQTAIDSPSAVYLKSVAPIYTFVLALCILTHIPIVLLTMIPKSLLNFAPNLAYLSDTSFTSVFIPPVPLPSWRMSCLSNGVHVFLLWDSYIGATATILWATVLSVNSSTEREILDPDTGSPILWGAKSRSWKVWWNVGSKILGWTVIAGPFAAVAVLLWERDEIVRMKVKRGI